MKNKLLTMTLILSVLGLTWWAYQTYGPHSGLVTLDVRNEPLREVVRKLERQTGQTIHLHKNVDAIITLSVRDMPLDHVLNQIAEQSQALWTSLYSIYSSDKALQTLEKSIRGELTGEANEWKEFQSTQSNGKRILYGPPPGSSDQSQALTVQLKTPEPKEAARTLSEIGGAQVVLEDTMKGSINLDLKETSMTDAVTQLAKQVQGHWSHFYVIQERPPMVLRLARRGGQESGETQTGRADNRGEERQIFKQDDQSPTEGKDQFQKWQQMSPTERQAQMGAEIRQKAKERMLQSIRSSTPEQRVDRRRKGPQIEQDDAIVR